jgi:hypothetical protein
VATIDELHAVALQHAKAEADGDLDTTLATLEDDCVYELQPVRRRLVGKDRARRYYDYFFANFMPRVQNYEMRGEWLDDGGLLQEYTMWVRDDDGNVGRYDLIGVLTFGAERLSGERLYGNEQILRLLFGPLYDETEPLP